MHRKVKTFSSGDRVVVEISFTCEDDAEIESVEAIFVREGSNEEITLLGDARKESSPEDERAVYTARLETEINPGVARGEYRSLHSPLCPRPVRRRLGLHGRGGAGPRRSRAKGPEPARSHDERLPLRERWR